MDTYQQLKQQVFSLLQDTINFSKTHHWDNIIKRLEKAETRLSESKVFVVVCGEFKQGKSSLLNAFLNDNGLFPVDVDIATNLISTIIFGSSEQITVFLEGGKEKKQISRVEIPDYVTEQRNTDNARRADFLTIEAPYPQLKEGLVLVDTPGIGSLNTEHTALTCGFIHHGDIILFVSDAQSPLSNIELTFVKEKIIPHCQNVIFVVTKIDAVRNYEEIVENNLDKLSKILELPQENIAVIPVSSQAKIDYIESQDLEDLEDSNFEFLENTISNLITEQKGRILLLRALNELSQALIGMKGSIQIQLEACKQDNKQELGKLERQFQEAQQQRQQLLENNSKWSTRLIDGLQDIQMQIQGEFQQGFTQIRRRANQYLDDFRLLERPEEIQSLLEADIDGMVTVLSKELNDRAASLYTDLEALTELNFNSTGTSVLNFRKSEIVATDVQIEKAGWFELSLNAVKSAMFNMSAGSVVGGILGGVIGGVGGFFLGAGVGALPGAAAGAQWGTGLGTIAGIGKGLKDGLSQTKEKDKQEIRKIIIPFLEDSQLICSQTLNRAVKGLERSMRDELTDRIKQQKETLEHSLNSIKELSKFSQDKVAKIAEELQPRLQYINQLQQKVEHLMKQCSSS
ncbi:dynamin family protein [Coleofasciculus sp. FACHB-712]|uniref:dynamin family protein n=1 Tax=Coleofasciculus sp. FACHB-712 TaxID=2692789 RepID=UPI001685544B|nr:dynamin family protein [Coleofasciculus sp. FACHB-712]MBD1944371.1 dynamin family protein [Coleofasciculus sp. FACHB-712]